MGTGSAQPAAAIRSCGCAAELTDTSSGGRGRTHSDRSHPSQLVPTLLGTAVPSLCAGICLFPAVLQLFLHKLTQLCC
ncbi:hypothetical protein CIB84_015545 [Bambusicola thoracicus]|uniref:Uncharacterized protein n=1 Tax=Bambusicola thoracicus TaxID=9083 RepID=A0A2P4S9C8_BAMTH|nr:hypothetical protein CIB84_015545 [Bambusicola thoracicus]